MAMGDLQRGTAGGWHKERHELRHRISSQHCRSVERGDSIAYAGENPVGVRGRVIGVGKYCYLRVVVEEAKQAIGDVIDSKSVLIVLSQWIRCLGDSQAQVLALRSHARTAHHPSIGIS